MPEGLTAIVCDDAPGFRALMSALLGDEGLEVVGEAATWEEAELLAPGVDAIIADLWMPEMDLDALARVRASAPEATLAVVSALDAEEARRHIAGIDADLVLPKIAPPHEIAAAVARHARERAAGGVGS